MAVSSDLGQQHFITHCHGQRSTIGWKGAVFDFGNPAFAAANEVDSVEAVLDRVRQAIFVWWTSVVKGWS
jgi:hypothetical protein